MEIQKDSGVPFVVEDGSCPECFGVVKHGINDVSDVSKDRV